MVSAHFLPQILAGNSENLSCLGNRPVVTDESFQDRGALRFLDAASQSAFVPMACIADGHSDSLNEIIKIERLFQIVESPVTVKTVFITRILTSVDLNQG